MKHSLSVAARESTVVANTNGWDTAYGITFDDVNQAILNDPRDPGDFDVTDPATGSTLRMFGDFKKWQVNGGSGHLLGMALPADDFTLENFLGVPEIIKLNPIFTIEVELELIETSDAAFSAETGTPMDLKIKLPNNNEMPVQISVTDITWDGYDPNDTMDQAVFAVAKQLMEEWLFDPDNIAEFGHTFATVNLNQRVVDAEGNDFDWLSPSYVAYGVSSQPNDEGGRDGILALMCMGQNRAQFAPTNRGVSPALIPEGARSGFLISKERFLSQMLMPGIVQTFVNDGKREDKVWIAENFKIAGNGTRIENSAALSIDQLDIGTDDEPKLVEATLPSGGMQIVMEDTHLTVRYEGLSHPYGETFAGWLTNATHQIKAGMYAGLTDDNKFILIPGEDIDSEEELEVITHTASLEKTTLADVIDWTLIALDALTIVATGAVAIKGLRAASGAAKTTSTTARLTTQATQTARLSTDSASSALSVGAQSVSAGFSTGRVAIKGFPWKTMFEIWGGLLLVMNGVNLYKSILQEQASGSDGEAAKSIPDIADFAARVMTPVQWPASTGFDVKSVKFNGGFHVVGDPTFADAPVEATS